MNLFKEGESNVSTTKPRDIPKIKAKSRPKQANSFGFFSFPKLKEESSHAIKHFPKWDYSKKLVKFI